MCSTSTLLWLFSGQGMEKQECGCMLLLASKVSGSAIWQIAAFWTAARTHFGEIQLTPLLQPHTSASDLQQEEKWDVQCWFMDTADVHVSVHTHTLNKEDLTFWDSLQWGTGLARSTEPSAVMVSTALVQNLDLWSPNSPQGLQWGELCCWVFLYSKTITAVQVLFLHWFLFLRRNLSEYGFRS